MEQYTKKFYCKECKKLVCLIEEGSKLKKGLIFLCEPCYDNLQSGNMFGDVFGGFADKKKQ